MNLNHESAALLGDRSSRSLVPERVNEKSLMTTFIWRARNMAKVKAKAMGSCRPSGVFCMCLVCAHLPVCATGAAGPSAAAPSAAGPSAAAGPSDAAGPQAAVPSAAEPSAAAAPSTASGPSDAAGPSAAAPSAVAGPSAAAGPSATAPSAAAATAAAVGGPSASPPFKWRRIFAADGTR